MAIPFQGKVWYHNRMKWQPRHPAMRTVVRAFVAETTPVYAVGGVVRDFLLARETDKTDVDLLLERAALPTAQRIANRLGWAFYPLDATRDVARLVFTATSGDPLVCDVASLRGGSLETDLRSRDFTVNAMAFALSAGDEATLIDPCNGQADLALRCIRRVTPTSFAEDPVRLLRAVRFVHQLGFSLDEETRLQIKRMGSTVKLASAERIRDELWKILATDAPAAALDDLRLLGLLPQVLPEVGLTEGVEQRFGQTAATHDWLLDPPPPSKPAAPAPPSKPIAPEWSDVEWSIGEWATGEWDSSYETPTVEWATAEWHSDGWAGDEQLHEADGLDGESAPTWDVYTHTLAAVTHAATIRRWLKGEVEPPSEPDSWQAALMPWRTHLRQHFAQPLAVGRTRADWLPWHALLHDIGKPATRSLEPDATGALRVHYVGHERASAAQAASLLDRLRFGRQEVAMAAAVAAHHMRLHQIHAAFAGRPISRRACFRFFRLVGGRQFSQLLGVDAVMVALADMQARPQQRPPDWPDVLAHCAQLITFAFAADGLRHTQDNPLLDGNGLMQAFHLQPGRQVGEILEHILEAQAAGEIQSRAEALTLAHRRLHEQLA